MKGGFPLGEKTKLGRTHSKVIKVRLPARESGPGGACPTCSTAVWESRRRSRSATPPRHTALSKRGAACCPESPPGWSGLGSRGPAATVVIHKRKYKVSKYITSVYQISFSFFVFDMATSGKPSACSGSPPPTSTRGGTECGAPSSAASLSGPSSRPRTESAGREIAGHEAPPAEPRGSTKGRRDSRKRRIIKLLSHLPHGSHTTIDRLTRTVGFLKLNINPSQFAIWRRISQDKETAHANEK